MTMLETETSIDTPLPTRTGADDDTNRDQTPAWAPRPWTPDTDLATGWTPDAGAGTALLETVSDPAAVYDDEDDDDDFFEDDDDDDGEDTFDEFDDFDEEDEQDDDDEDDDDL